MIAYPINRTRHKAKKTILQYERAEPPFYITKARICICPVNKIHIPNHKTRYNGVSNKKNLFALGLFLKWKTIPSIKVIMKNMKITL